MTVPSGPPVPDPPGTPIPVLKSARALLSDAQFNDVRGTILDNNPGMDPEIAGRILVDALGFVATAAGKPGRGLVPSRVVDEGWHALILHTGLYYDLCNRFGNFVHHIPDRQDLGRDNQASVDHTVDRMRAAGHEPDLDLWRGPEDRTIPVAAKCRHSDDTGPIITIPKPKPNG
ncbi:glycine-rich domain-containing protein [Streptomyces sp. NPDC002889]|uniref:glycine-rich domain-containing protein n=1 Tax=Streptomyces sp. NPDC002889 TaxID=3364669 RepID=UPI0036C2436F